LEAEPLTGLPRAPEPAAGPVPVTRRGYLELRVASREAHNRLRELADRGFGAARDVVDIAGHTARRAEKQPPDDVVNVDEVARGDARVVEPQWQAPECAVDEGRHDVAPDRRRRTAPPPRAEDLARPVNVLEPRAHGRNAVLALVPDAVELAHHFGDLVRAV